MILDGLPAWQHRHYNCDFSLADATYQNRRTTTTTENRAAHWRNQFSYVQLPWVDPELQEAPYRSRIRCLSGFVACVRTGYYSHGEEVQAGTVSGALKAVGQTITLTYKCNLTKTLRFNKFTPTSKIRVRAWGIGEGVGNRRLCHDSFLLPLTRWRIHS